MQKFFTDTIEGKFIKALLFNTPIPLLNTVSEGDFLIADNEYIYQNSIIKCVKSGYIRPYQLSEVRIDRKCFYKYDAEKGIPSNRWINLSADLYFYDYDYRLIIKHPKHSRIKIVTQNKNQTSFTLAPSNSANIQASAIAGEVVASTTSRMTYDVIIYYCAENNNLGNIILQTLPEDECEIAEYIKLKDYMFGNEDLEFARTYKSNYKYYDSDTHYHLGNYLRAYRDIYGINLMPLYNCFNYKAIDNFYFQANNGVVEVHDENNLNHKLLVIPIKFNKKYTIAFDAESQVIMKPVFYNDLGLIKIGGTDTTQYLHDSISGGDRLFSRLDFKKPFVYEVRTKNKKLLEKEKYLYLIIQASKTNDSSLVVLEGDYTYLGDKTINFQYNKQLNDQELNNYYLSDLSLLTINDHNHYAFADTLIEYLLWQVITPRDEISQNIKKVQEFLLKKSAYYRTLYKNRQILLGVWDFNTRRLLFEAYKRDKNNPFKDFFGYVDRDAEVFVNKG